MNADESNHIGHTTTEPEVPLPNATVTISFDGLIYTAYDAGQRLYQAAVHTENIDHQLTINVSVKEGGNSQPLFPTDKSPWNSEYGAIKKEAPYWLYVDSGNGLQPEEFSAELYLPKDESDERFFERSFNRILNFQDLFGRKITLNTKKFAEFNFPHGICYSAQNTNATLRREGGRGEIEPTRVSTLGAIDINLVSDQSVNREIVLMNKYKDKVFSFPLENGKHYNIEVRNRPKPANGNGHQAEPVSHPQGNHFVRYYDMFELKRNEHKVLLEPVPGLADDEDAPPCISGSGDRVNGLP